MNQDELAARHTAAIRRHWRTLTDSGGQPPQALLDELAAIAEYHADGRTMEALKALSEQETPPAQAPATEPAPPPAKPAPRRTTTARKSTK
jgi:hypothetical protein